MEVYFDNAATTKPYLEVVKQTIRIMEEDYGNPSSLHMKGIEAERIIRDATNIIAKQLNCLEKEITFTSGGTESNNLAIIGTAMAQRRRGKHIITSAIEHDSVLATVDFLASEGFEVTKIGVDKKGIINLDELKSAVRDDTILVAIMYVNNETGSVQPIEEIASIIKEKNQQTLFHVDAVQAFGKYTFSPKKLGVDLMSFSAHKIHGPKGCGALYIRNKVLIRPIIYGGGQQKGVRSGTENVNGIAGFGVATEITYRNIDKDMTYVRSLKDEFIKEITSISEVCSNSGEAPHIASISFVGIRSEVLLHSLEDKGIYVSAGSACSSNTSHKSNVLAAIKLPKKKLESTLRFSFSTTNSIEEVNYTLTVLKEMIPLLRRYTRNS